MDGHYQYRMLGTCATGVEFDVSGTRIRHIVFHGGCEGNLRTVSKLLDGWDAEDIARMLKGNRCGKRETSCADQLADAVMRAVGR